MLVVHGVACASLGEDAQKRISAANIAMTDDVPEQRNHRQQGQGPHREGIDKDCQGQHGPQDRRL